MGYVNNMDCAKKIIIDIEELVNLHSILDKVAKILPYRKQERLMYKGMLSINNGDIPLYEKRNLQKLYNYRLKTFRVLDSSFSEECIFSYADGTEQKCAILEFCKDHDIGDCRPRSCLGTK